MTHECEILVELREEYDPEAHYPPKGTPEEAILVVINEEQYSVVAWTGRYFHGQIACAGFDGEEVGITGIPCDPGIYLLTNGTPFADRETCDSGIDADIRRATDNDLERFGVPYLSTNPAIQPERSS